MIQFIYYQHSYIQDIPEIPIQKEMGFDEIKNNYIKNEDRGGYFASYITEFDCAEQTNWWFTVKDDDYDTTKLSSKKRYEITKANKFCIAKKINPSEYMDQLFDCYKKSYNAYPKKYRPEKFDYEEFRLWMNDIEQSYNKFLYATFYKENNELIGFNCVILKENILGLTLQKTNPEYEKYNSNASLLDCMLNDWNEKLKNHEVIISNGSRSIKHQTNFNSYLEKYFGFRKAYAKLRIVYKFPIGFFVTLLRPFAFLMKNTNISFIYNVYCLLKMDSFKYKK